jgi:hypothetical protein
LINFFIRNNITKKDKIILFGDFNFNFKLNNNLKNFEYSLRDYDLKSVLSINTSTTDANTQIDGAFSNLSKEEFISDLYESYFSFHKAIWVCLNEN